MDGMMVVPAAPYRHSRRPHRHSRVSGNLAAAETQPSSRPVQSSSRRPLPSFPR